MKTKTTARRRLSELLMLWDGNDNLNYGCHEWLAAFGKALNAKLSCPQYLSASWHPCVLAHLYACKQLNNEHMSLHPRPPLPPFSKAGCGVAGSFLTRLGMLWPSCFLLPRGRGAIVGVAPDFPQLTHLMREHLKQRHTEWRIILQCFEDGLARNVQQLARNARGRGQTVRLAR
jgi:hypothetical protein